MNELTKDELEIIRHALRIDICKEGDYEDALHGLIFVESPVNTIRPKSKTASPNARLATIFIHKGTLPTNGGVKVERTRNAINSSRVLASSSRTRCSSSFLIKS